jgi:hypothetical protein
MTRQVHADITRPSGALLIAASGLSLEVIKVF